MPEVMETQLYLKSLKDPMAPVPIQARVQALALKMVFPMALEMAMEMTMVMYMKMATEMAMAMALAMEMATEMAEITNTVIMVRVTVILPTFLSRFTPPNPPQPPLLLPLLNLINPPNPPSVTPPPTLLSPQVPHILIITDRTGMLPPSTPALIMPMIRNTVMVDPTMINILL